MLLVSLCLLVGLLTGQSNGCKLDTYEKDLFGAKDGDWEEPIQTLQHLVNCLSLLNKHEGNESRVKELFDLMLLIHVNEEFCFKYQPEDTNDERNKSDDGNKIKISPTSDFHYSVEYYMHKQNRLCNTKFESLVENFEKEIGYDVMAANKLMASKVVELTTGKFGYQNPDVDPKEFAKPLSEAIAFMAKSVLGSRIKALEQYKSEIHTLVDTFCEKGLEKLKPILTYYRKKSSDDVTAKLMDVMDSLSLCGTYYVLDVMEASFEKYNQLIQEASKGRLSKILRCVTCGSSS